MSWPGRKVNANASCGLAVALISHAGMRAITGALRQRCPPSCSLSLSLTHKNNNPSSSLQLIFFAFSFIVVCVERGACIVVFPQQEKKKLLHGTLLFCCRICSGAFVTILPCVCFFLPPSQSNPAPPANGGSLVRLSSSGRWLGWLFFFAS